MLQAFLGSPDFQHQTVANFQSNETFTAAAVANTIVSVPANTTDQAVNLATLFPALTATSFIVVQDVTATPGQPFSVTTVSGSGRIAIAGGGFLAWTQNGGAPPTLYLTNPSTTTASDIQISVMSN